MANNTPTFQELAEKLVAKQQDLQNHIEAYNLEAMVSARPRLAEGMGALEKVADVARSVAQGDSITQEQAEELKIPLEKLQNFHFDAMEASPHILSSIKNLIPGEDEKAAQDRYTASHDFMKYTIGTTGFAKQFGAEAEKEAGMQEPETGRLKPRKTPRVKKSERGQESEISL